MANAVKKKLYDTFIADVAALYAKAQKTVALTYWEIGRRIVEVEQDGAVRAQYGSKLLQQISRDLTKQCGAGFSVDKLERMRKYYQQNKKSATSRKLDWSAQVALLPLKDDAARKRIATRAVKEKLPVREVRRIVKKQKLEDRSKKVEKNERGSSLRTPNSELRTVLKRPANVVLDTYALLPDDYGDVPQGKRLLDLGFHVCHEVSKTKKVTLAKKPSYTYRARVERVVDGDTIIAVMSLGFGARVTERLRLRGIDTAELGTPEGDAAKRFVTRLLPKGTPLVIRTHSTDIYGRYVADVFFQHTNDPRIKNTNSTRICDHGLYLNQELLREGFAQRI